MLSAGIMFSSCDNKKSAIEGYEWLEGKWVNDGGIYNCVVITDEYCQYTSELWDNEIITDLTNQPKEPMSIEITYDQFLQGDFKTFAGGMYFIDEVKQQIFWLYDFDIKMYLKKVE